MALTVTGISPALFEVVHGQVIEATITVDSTSSLAGKTIRVFQELFAASPINLQYPGSIASNYFEVAYPAGPGTVSMTWVGSKKFQNLTMSLEHVSTTQFRVYLDALVGTDRPAFINQFDPSVLITPQDLQFSIYEMLRYLNLHFYEVGTSNQAVAGIPTTGALPKRLTQDKFGYNLIDVTTGQSVAQPFPASDLEVKFSMENTTGLNAIYDLIIFNTSFCATNDQLLSLQDNLNLEGAQSPTPTALPSLVATNINSMTNIANATGDFYEGSFVIDANKIIKGCELTFIIVVTDTGNKKIAYTFSLRPESKEAPDPSTTVSGVINGDPAIYTNGAFVVTRCQKIQLSVEMDVDDYDLEISNLGLIGNYGDNLIVINVYALDHKPVANEDLSQYPILDTVGGPPLLPGAAFYNYQVPEDYPISIIFIVFDFVFKDHSIRAAIKLLLPTLADFDNNSFTDANDVAINNFCYDYANGLKVVLNTTDINAFDFNNLKIYRQGSNLIEEVDIIDESVAVVYTDDTVTFQVDLDVVEPGDCFCAVASRVPAVADALGACGAVTFSMQLDAVAVNRLQLTVDVTAGAPLFPRTFFTVKKDGVIVHQEYTENQWTIDPPYVFSWNQLFTTRMDFVVELRMYTDDGCEYYEMIPMSILGFVGESIPFTPVPPAI